MSPYNIEINKLITWELYVVELDLLILAQKQIDYTLQYWDICLLNGPIA